MIIKYLKNEFDTSDVESFEFEEGPGSTPCTLQLKLKNKVEMSFSVDGPDSAKQELRDIYAALLESS